ncbi:MAG: hypothetical protein KIS79_14310 [Burkholderiales bacterium]|nr:hypothetical protein [Burkholderiales bacterium]
MMRPILSAIEAMAAHYAFVCVLMLEDQPHGPLPDFKGNFFEVLIDSYPLKKWSLREF